IIFTYGCGQSEYRSEAGECCPICSIGQIVFKDCTGDLSTTCKPCYSGTFMDQPNDLSKCFQCKVCDKEQGFYDATACTTMHDAVCGVLDGYYCTKKNEYHECTYAKKHRQCVRGEETTAPESCGRNRTTIFAKIPVKETLHHYF
ncbi:hypothetical protein NFI96_011518, partial [Prochilodus magdalenae]